MVDLLVRLKEFAHAHLLNIIKGTKQKIPRDILQKLIQVSKVCLFKVVDFPYLGQTYEGDQKKFNIESNGKMIRVKMISQYFNITNKIWGFCQN